MKPQAATRYVVYLRVSTQKQGASGLGMEAQQAAVTAFLGSAAPVATFVEVESGKRTAGERPQLAAALAACRLHRATLLVAKMDRLARNAAFLLNLRDAGVEFVAADMPHANRLTVGIMAMVAEEEAAAISTRTKNALAAAKARGVKLGKPANLSNEHRQRGAAVAAELRTAKATVRVADLAATVREIQGRGIVSTRGIAAELNALGIPTARGGHWGAVQVSRVLERLAA